MKISLNFKPEIKAKIGRYGARIKEVENMTKIRDDIYVSGELSDKGKGCDIPEQYMVINTSQGIVLLTGCAHPGIVEIVQHAKSAFDSNVRLLIGGFHLKDCTVEEACGVISRLRALGVSRVAPFHCVGRKAQGMFSKSYGSDYVMMSEGNTIAV